MNVQIRDATAFRRISPVMLHTYLEAKGWSHQETWRNRVTVWVKEHEGQSYKILALLREWAATYAAHISEAVSTFSTMEERSQLDVYYDLLGAGADVIRLRSLNGFGHSDLSLIDSVSLLNCARDLLRAAARTAEHPGLPVYRDGISGELTEYLQGIHPLPGYGAGYECTLHSRIPAGYGVQDDLGDSVRAPFARRTTIALNNGLREAGKVAEAVLGGEEIASFEKSVPQGISANFLGALAELSRQGNGISVSLAWAPVRPSNLPDASDAEFTFPESSADVFAEGAEFLRQTSPFRNAHVTGEVVRLNREPREEFDGQAAVLFDLDGRPVALEVQFDEADHDEVVQAFREGIMIRVDGDIQREGRQYWLKNPRNFSLVG